MISPGGRLGLIGEGAPDLEVFTDWIKRFLRPDLIIDPKRDVLQVARRHVAGDLMVPGAERQPLGRCGERGERNDRCRENKNAPHGRAGRVSPLAYVDRRDSRHDRSDDTVAAGEAEREGAGGGRAGVIEQVALERGTRA